MSTDLDLWVRGATVEQTAAGLASALPGARIVGSGSDTEVVADDVTLEVYEEDSADPDFACFPVHVGIFTARDPSMLQGLVLALSREPFEEVLATSNFDADHPIAHWRAAVQQAPAAE